jgi:hypothetical protein
MIGQYLPNNNETATIAFHQKICQLNSLVVALDRAVGCRLLLLSPGVAPRMRMGRSGYVCCTHVRWYWYSASGVAGVVAACHFANASRPAGPPEDLNLCNASCTHDWFRGDGPAACAVLLRSWLARASHLSLLLLDGSFQ